MILNIAQRNYTAFSGIFVKDVWINFSFNRLVTSEYLAYTRTWSKRVGIDFNRAGAHLLIAEGEVIPGNVSHEAGHPNVQQPAIRDLRKLVRWGRIL